MAHPKGYLQPGVLALTNSGRILYRWRSVPSAENLNGTLARPTAKHAWSAIQRSLADADDAKNAEHDDNPEIDQAPPPRLVFIAALIANGWFLRIKSFVYSPGAEPVPRRFAAAFRRWLLFIALWIAAVAFLPITPVFVAFMSWTAWIVRDVRGTMSSLDVQQEISARK